MVVEIQLFEITGRAYVDFLQNELPLLLEEVHLAKRLRMVLQHNGAPAHYRHLVTHYLNLTFPERWIGRGGHVQWPPRSPDRTPLDFCLWGWMKREVYKEKVNTRNELEALSMNSAALLNQERQDDLRRAMRTIVKRVEKCIEVNDGIFEHLL
jgi:hypothetical protein